MSETDTSKPNDGEDFAVSTIRDYGFTLPIGVPEGKPPALEKKFAFKVYRTKDEQAIEKARKGKNHPGWDVVSVLAHMLTEWGGDNDFANKPEKLRRSAVARGYLADVLYAYILLRIEALGAIIGLKQECPSCEHEWDWRADLRDVEITVADTFGQLECEYELKHKIEIGDKNYDTLVIAPPTWAAITGISTDKRKGGLADIKMGMIVNSIRAMSNSKNGKQKPVTVGPSMLGEMSKYDLERLATNIDRLFPNVDISLAIECPACGNKWEYNTQWAFDFFFGGSSLPLEM